MVETFVVMKTPAASIRLPFIAAIAILGLSCLVFLPDASGQRSRAKSVDLDFSINKIGKGELYETRAKLAEIYTAIKADYEKAFLTASDRKGKNMPLLILRKVEDKGTSRNLYLTRSRGTLTVAEFAPYLSFSPGDITPRVILSSKGYVNVNYSKAVDGNTYDSEFASVAPNDGGNTEPENTEPENSEPENSEPENSEPENFEPENSEPENGKTPEKPENTEPVKGKAPEKPETPDTSASGKVDPLLAKKMTELAFFELPLRPWHIASIEKMREAKAKEIEKKLAEEKTEIEPRDFRVYVAQPEFKYWIPGAPAKLNKNHFLKLLDTLGSLQTKLDEKPRCKTCNGFGEIKDTSTRNRSASGKVKCPECRGAGHIPTLANYRVTR